VEIGLRSKTRKEPERPRAEAKTDLTTLPLERAPVGILRRCQGLPRGRRRKVNGLRDTKCKKTPTVE